MSATPAAPQPHRNALAAGPAAAETLPLMSELVTSPPSFRVAFRGYDAREVDRWANLMKAEVQAAKVAHSELAADVRSLADQLDRATEELAVLRRRPAVDDTIAFRHLGPRVEQILVDAHAEADEVLRSASTSAQELREHTEEQLSTTREQYARAVAEFESHRRWLQEEEERWTRLLRSRRDAAERADEYRRRARHDAEELLEAATTQQERVVASALARTEHMLKEAADQATAIREAAQRAAQAEQARAEEARTELARAEQAHAELARAERARAHRDESERGPAGARGEAAAGHRERDDAAASGEAVGSAELGQSEPVVGKAGVGTPAATGSAEPARGVAKVVYVVNPDEPAAEASVEPPRSTVDAR